MLQHRVVNYDDTGLFQSAPVNGAVQMIIA
jgi:hypothetical protein